MEAMLSYDLLLPPHLECTAYVPSVAATDAEPVDSSSDVILEWDDDPHRLARVNLERYASSRDGATLRFWRDEWYVWKQDRYRRIPTSELRAKITASVRREFESLWIEALAKYEEWRASDNYNEDEDKGPPKIRRVPRNLITDVINATAGMVVVSTGVEQRTWIGIDGIKERRNYVAMKNGILNMTAVMANEDDVIRPHSPEWFSTISLPYEYDSTVKPPRRWLDFLKRTMDEDESLISILQEWAGYLLLPDTGEQKFLVNEGEGGNGKSVFCAAISAMLGKDNCSHVPLEDFGGRFSKSSTLGKLVNICADVGELDRVAEGYLKSFTSGDAMFFDRKGIEPIQCVPTARLMVNWNNRPRINDPSSGVWRRMILIPWNAEITEAEKVKGMDKAEWWERSGELPGILNWAILGLARLRSQRGFTQAKKEEDARDDYRKDANPTRRFFLEHMEPIVTNDTDSCRGIYCEFLYNLYVHWMKSSGHKGIFASNVFGKQLRKVFKQVERVRNYREKDTEDDKKNARWFYRGVKFSHDVIFGWSTEQGACYLDKTKEQKEF